MTCEQRIIKALIEQFETQYGVVAAFPVVEKLAMAYEKAGALQRSVLPREEGMVG